MIHFDSPPEPPGFDDQCRKAGAEWLAANQGKRPKDLWSPFRRDLRRGFRRLCAYSAMYVPDQGTVDHFLPLDRDQDYSQAYEWSNYRFASGMMNNWKRKAGPEDILDPFRVQEGWFEIVLPSLQLTLSPAVPPEFRDLAEKTLTRLKLRDHETLVEIRREWLNLFESGRLDLEGLFIAAPLVARAVAKRDGLERSP